MKKCRECQHRGSEQASSCLRSSPQVYLSEANFILFRVYDPDFVHTALRKEGVLVRNTMNVLRG